MRLRDNTPSWGERLHRPVAGKLYGKGSQVPHLDERSNKPQENIEDSKIRMEINELINDYIFNNKSLIELINKLNSEQRYKKYGKYFELWISEKNAKKEEFIKAFKSEQQKGESTDKIIEKLSRIARYETYKKYIPNVVSLIESDEEKDIEH